MKKFLASVFIFTVGIFCLSGCSSPVSGNVGRENRLNSAFSAKMTISLDKMAAEGTVERIGDGKWSAEFESPNTLSGVTLEFDGNNTTASYKGLTFSVPRSAVPVKAMLKNLIDAVDSNAREAELHGSESEGMLQISGSLDGGDYTLSIDSSGCISSFEMPNNLLKIAFSDVQINGSTAQPESETSADENSSGENSESETSCAETPTESTE